VSEVSSVRICALAGDLGFGFPDASLDRALAMKPDAIVLQGTSADPGPYYLGAAKSFYPLGGVRRDLAALLPKALASRVPVILSVGGAGERTQVDAVVEIVAELAGTHGLAMRMAVLHADLDKAELKSRLARGAVMPRLTPWPTLSERLLPEDVDRSAHIVAQIGPEPIMRALGEHADVVVAGRTVDASLFAAVPLMRGCDPGLVYHMAKTVECGAMAAVPGTAGDGLLAEIGRNSFIVQPLDTARRCTVISVVGHSFYEREDPFLDDLPGGSLDISNAVYKQLDERSVEVSGSLWRPASRYMVKLEGAERVGFRSFCLAGIRDPIMIRQLDGILEQARRVAAGRYRGSDATYDVAFRVYGRDAVMGPVEPERHRLSHEIGLVIDVVAATQLLADEVCALLRSCINHDHFPGCRTSAGNLAFAFSPSDVSAGPVYRFNIWHLLPLEDATSLFAPKFFEFGKR
jgi:hypothetical protein